MKSFNYKALATAAAAVCGASVAVAGQITAPSSPTLYAIEAVKNTTTVTVPALTYAMGVARASGQNFTYIVKVPAGSPVTFGSCPTTYTGTSANLSPALKRSAANECAYDITVANGSAVNDAITLVNFTITNHAMGSGTNLSVFVNLADPGETARVDNNVDKEAVIGAPLQAISLNVAADTHTTADVNFNGGNSPLFGFVANTTQGATSTTADTNSVTYANFGLNVNTSLKDANGVAVNATTLVNTVTFTLAGDYTNVDAANTAVTFVGGAGNSAAVNANGAANGSITFTLAGANLAATTTIQVGLKASGTGSLGTQRSFTVSAAVVPTVGANESLTTSTTWWTWKANAIQLATPFFNNFSDASNFTRFFFQNLGAAAKYSATCYGESGVTPVNGTAVTGTLVSGTTMVKASDICTFSSGSRGSIVFTINSAASKIKGVYQQAINGAAASYIPLDRPYANGTY